MKHRNDIEDIRTALADLPDIEPEGQESTPADLLSIAETFATTLRKVGLQNTRSSSEAANAARDMVARLDELADSRKASLNLAQVLMDHLDFLDRAIDLLRQADGLGSWGDQLGTGRTELLTKAQRAGLCAIGTVGEDFDADLHDATNRLGPAGDRIVVSSVLRHGYVFGPDVLRRATVTISHESKGIVE
jgi:molecular chaperone GrpE (heat shock protein)